MVLSWATKYIIPNQKIIKIKESGVAAIPLDLQTYMRYSRHSPLTSPSSRWQVQAVISRSMFL